MVGNAWVALKSTFTTQLLPTASVPPHVLPLILKRLLTVTLLILNAALPVLTRRNFWVVLVLKNGE